MLLVAIVISGLIDCRGDCFYSLNPTLTTDTNQLLVKHCVVISRKISQKWILIRECKPGLILTFWACLLVVIRLGVHMGDWCISTCLVYPPSPYLYINVLVTLGLAPPMWEMYVYLISQ